MISKFSHSAALDLTKPGYSLILLAEDRLGHLFYSCDLLTTSENSLPVARFSLSCSPSLVELLDGPVIWLDVGINRPFYFSITFKSRDILNSFLEKTSAYWDKHHV